MGSWPRDPQGRPPSFIFSTASLLIFSQSNFELLFTWYPPIPVLGHVLVFKAFPNWMSRPRSGHPADCRLSRSHWWLLNWPHPFFSPQFHLLAVREQAVCLKPKFTGSIGKVRDSASVCWFMGVNAQLYTYEIRHHHEQSWISWLH